MGCDRQILTISVLPGALAKNLHLIGRALA